MYQFLVLWPDDDPSLGSKLVAIYIKIFISELDVILKIFIYIVMYKHELQKIM